VIEKFLSGEPITFEGYLVGKEKGRVTIQLHPGLTIDIDEDKLEALEEATDPVTGRTFIRVTLRADADINACFQPRLARLSFAMQTHTSEVMEGAVPFSLSGELPASGDFAFETDPSSAFAAAPTGPGGGTDGGSKGGRWQTYGTPWIGEKETQCRRHFWGWVTDDRKPVSGVRTDYRWVPA
jgi:hypothetical protein